MSLKRIDFESTSRINENRGWWAQREVKLESYYKGISIKSSFSKRRNLETKRVCNQRVNDVFEEKNCRTWKIKYRDRETWIDDLKQAEKCFTRKRTIKDTNKSIKELDKSFEWSK